MSPIGTGRVAHRSSRIAQAVARAKAGTLPEQYPLRADLELLIDLLAA